MNKYQDKIYKFMYGRYGIDDLYKFSFILYIVLVFINIFIESKIISLVELFIIVSMMYRSLSKNKYKRSLENKYYLKIKRWIIKPFTNIIRNYNDIDHVYRRCHHCKTTLKLPIPKKMGIKHSMCPICKKDNTYIIFKHQKVEVIRK